MNRNAFTNLVFWVAFVVAWVVALSMAQRFDHRFDLGARKADRAQPTAGAVVKSEFNQLAPRTEVQQGGGTSNTGTSPSNPGGYDAASPAKPDAKEREVAVDEAVVKPSPQRSRHVPLPRPKPCPIVPYCKDYRR